MARWNYTSDFISAILHGMTYAGVHESGEMGRIHQMQEMGFDTFIRLPVRLFSKEINQATEYKTAWNSTLYAIKGDFEILDIATEEKWPIGRYIFGRSYAGWMHDLRDVPTDVLLRLTQDKYQAVYKKAPVWAQEIRTPMVVHTREGDVQGAPGQWWCAGVVNEEWVIGADKMKHLNPNGVGYEPVPLDWDGDLRFVGQRNGSTPITPANPSTSVMAKYCPNYSVFNYDTGSWNKKMDIVIVVRETNPWFATQVAMFMPEADFNTHFMTSSISEEMSNNYQRLELDGYFQCVPVK